jgi:hypothetical protein
LYYETRVKHQIDDLWRETYMSENPNHDPSDPIPASKFADRNRVIGIIYKGETEEVKTAVKAEKAILDAQLQLQQDGEALNIVNDDAEDAEDAEGAAAGKQKRENIKKNQEYNK